MENNSEGITLSGIRCGEEPLVLDAGALYTNLSWDDLDPEDVFEKDKPRAFLATRRTQDGLL